jgi:hypothetical protein
MKFQIPSTKSQTIPNFQIRMTKTFGIWDFDHWDLFAIWNLELGISSLVQYADNNQF